MRADLHTHSCRSDGTDTPADLVRAAAGAGLDVIGLTDHDVAAGWAEAAAAAVDVGIGFVPGMEISCQLGGRAVHLLGYGVDPAHPALSAELDRVLSGRDGRMPEMLARLRDVGIDIDEADVREVAGRSSAFGRPHVGDALVAAGLVADRSEAFVRFLMPGRPGFVPRYTAPLPEMMRLVTAAGGVSVVAHPWARGSRLVLTPEALFELAAAGLTGVEVWHHDHTEGDARELAALAHTIGLVTTGSSDHHGLGKVDHDLGRHTTPPDQLELLLAGMTRAAADARAADPSVRPAPAVLG